MPLYTDEPSFDKPKHDLQLGNYIYIGSTKTAIKSAWIMVGGVAKAIFGAAETDEPVITDLVPSGECNEFDIPECSMFVHFDHNSGATDVDHTEFQFSTDGGSSWETPTNINGKPSSPREFTRGCGTTHHLRMRYQYNDGSHSEWSKVYSEDTPSISC